MSHSSVSVQTHDHYLENGEHIVSKNVQLSQIADWLKRGWHDMAHAPGISFFFGALMALAVFSVYFSFNNQPIMMFKVATFFVMLSPFLATGLYYVAHKLENGKPVHFYEVLTSWRSNSSNIALYALALGIIIAIWSRITPLIAALAVSDGLIIINPEVGLMSFMTSSLGLEFLAYFMLLASLVAVFVFMLSVVTIPLMLKDNKVGAISAMVLSFKVVMENKAVMAVWALIIGALLTFGLVTLGSGMLIIMPLLGYASWHAFNDLIEIDDGYPAINPS